MVGAQAVVSPSGAAAAKTPKLADILAAKKAAANKFAVDNAIEERTST